jgi:hypothetical protein
MKNLILGIFLIVLSSSLAGCGIHAFTLIDPVLLKQAPRLMIVSQPIGKGYYAVLQQKAGHWQIISISAAKINRRSHPDQEILFVNRGLRSIAPSFDPMANTGEATECTPLFQNNTT